MLVLTEEDVDQILTMDQCLEVLENTFLDYGRGSAASRPRTHTYTPVGDKTFYNFKSMDGAVPRYGVHALRISSEVCREEEWFGHRREEKLPLAPGGRFVGLIMLFDIATTEPIAILQDAGIQRMRVGATSGLAAKYLARPDAARVGLFGSGWQAGPQLEALVRVRPISSVTVFSVNPDHRKEFAQRMEAQLQIPVAAADDPREVVEGQDIVVCATNSFEPVFDGQWLQAGQHVNSLQSGELDFTVYQRADLIAIRSREQSLHFVQPDSATIPGHTEVTQSSGRYLENMEEKMVELGKVMAGLVPGRTAADQITVFGGSGTGPSSGLGIQFAAVGKVAVDMAKRHGLGHEIPTEWFTEVHHP